MAEFPAMPLWTDRHIADTDHLTDAEYRLYMRLKLAIWRAPDCRIPNDDQWLARKFRKTPEEVQSQIRPLISEFCFSTGNWLTEEDLQKQHAWVKSSSKKQSGRAKSRWQKEKTLCRGNAPIPKDSSLTPTSTETLSADSSPSSNNARARAKPRRKSEDAQPTNIVALPLPEDPTEEWLLFHPTTQEQRIMSEQCPPWGPMEQMRFQMHDVQRWMVQERKRKPPRNALERKALFLEFLKYMKARRIRGLGFTPEVIARIRGE